jgi:hypothetical protein
MLARRLGILSAQISIYTLEESDETFIFSLESDESSISGLSAEQIHFAIGLCVDTDVFLKEICILALKFFGIDVICSSCNFITAFSTIPDTRCNPIESK